MRQGQQSKRMRGRNRKGPNPLTRSYESNGGDVKIRGTASHVAEKYVQLARDAQASGDRVASENYFQHAEHYFRIVAAAQAQQQQQAAMRSDQNADGGDRQPNENRMNGHGSSAGDDSFDDDQPSMNGHGADASADSDDDKNDDAGAQADASSGDAPRPRTRSRRRPAYRDRAGADAAPPAPDAPQPVIDD